MAVDELRHTLSDLRGSAEALARRVEQSLDDDGRRLLDRVLAGVGRAEEVLDAVLAYDLGYRTPRPRPLRLPDLVRAACDAFVDDLEPGDRIEIGPMPECVVGDPEMVSAVLRVLVQNAVKFAHRRPHTVVVGGRENAREWVVEVADTGPGVPGDDLERIFGLYDDDTAGREPGQGIGLAACRRLVEAHGGRIWAEHAEGGGTVVSFTLPRDEGEVSR